LPPGDNSESISWLIINGDAFTNTNGTLSGDTVQLSGDWSSGANTEINGINYATYIASIDPHTSAGIIVEDDLKLQLIA